MGDVLVRIFILGSWSCVASLFSFAFLPFGYGSDMPKGEMPMETEEEVIETPPISDKGISTQGSPGSGSKEKRSTHLKQYADCSFGFQSSMPLPMVFDSEGKYLYLLVNASAKDIENDVKQTSNAVPKNMETKIALDQPKKGTSAANELNRARKKIVRFDSKTGNFDAILSSVQKTNATLIQHPGGVSSLNFVGPHAECGAGKARVISISLLERGKKSKAVHHSGRYRMLQSPSGWILADMTRNAIIDLDGAFFQKRTVKKLLADGFPLYYSPVEQLLVHFVEKNGKKGVMYERGTVAKSQKRLLIPEGENLIVSPTGIGVASLGQDHIITLQSLKDLNATKDVEEYRIQLPSAVKLQQLRFDADFSAKRVVAFGKDVSERRSLRKAWVYDCAQSTATVPVVMEPPEPMYVHGALLRPDGQGVVFDVRNSQTGQFEMVSFFSFLTKNFTTYAAKNL